MLPLREVNQHATEEEEEEEEEGQGGDEDEDELRSFHTIESSLWMDGRMTALLVDALCCSEKKERESERKRERVNGRRHDLM